MPVQDHDNHDNTPAEEHTIVYAVRELAHEFRQLTDQVVRMNGRLGKLESAEFERQIREAETRGRMQAAGEAIVTKATMAKLGAVVGAVSGGAGLLARFIA